ncbi:DUF2309 domain-containing protein [Nitrospira lenta]|uniref:Probable inorganic carbon transporter subunit DabA n=1 Tax=Nitrospira lenta TaxID=1436998 RepID=A0A330L4T5_9BACT|nr:DUF2309 domain-containing protein [Nitrospira lenta]SPP64339.1 conserved hypothetical protein [Nitrospira lenta]
MNRSHHCTDTDRMELRSYVNLAGEVVARLWPMRTFISRNPLQGLEHLPFSQAVQLGTERFGGAGYLSPQLYREAHRAGRISDDAIDQALAPLVLDDSIPLGSRILSHRDVLRAALIHDIEPSEFLSRTSALAEMDAERSLALVNAWMEQLPSADQRPQPPTRRQAHSTEWPFRETLATWCDRTLGIRIVERIDREMIKWCVAFCDEGEAAWSMPHREETFFRAWKMSVQHDWTLSLLGIRQSAEKIRALSDRPEDALLESLHLMQIPKALWQDYLSLHLTALPGWSGFIKWRADQTADPWQEAYRIDLVKYLAVRLFYERELIDLACRSELGYPGNFQALHAYTHRFPYAFWFRRVLNAGQASKQAVVETRRLRRPWSATQPNDWDQLGRKWHRQQRSDQQAQSAKTLAEALTRLADTLGLGPDALTDASPDIREQLANWLRAFPPHMRSMKWLEAAELTAERTVLMKLTPDESQSVRSESPAPARSLAQFVFCIDVRSEVFRRQLEQRGGYDTYGFAGFFGLPIAYRSLDEPHETALCPVLLKPKHVLREVPRTYNGDTAQRRRTIVSAVKAGQELLHDLKHNVITPYVMVEAVGWFFGWSLLGKTLFPNWYHRIAEWFRRTLMPAVATSVTVDKLTRHEAHEMVAAEQRMRILRWLRTHHQVEGALLTPQRLEHIRLQALSDAPSSPMGPGGLDRLLTLSPPQKATIFESLRRECRMTGRDNATRIDHITRTGFTPTEQAYYVETSLRLMGLTSSFARLIFLCGHGSTSQNNPYESALDCGACGGSQGLPNARVFATIANRPQVRDLLAARGFAIPSDTHFVAARHDTTTDRLDVGDLEDIPSTHRKELAQVLEDIAMAGAEAALERYGRLSGNEVKPVRDTALRAIERRSRDWAQVRPEWGLARNSWFIIGNRRLTTSHTLEGRAFLHSYDHAADPDGKLLEIIMTAPLIVAQWINSEYYFSTVAPDTYGSGSKVYHNVTGRIGVMTGNQSDLRMGLPVQSVMNGSTPYHDPLRLTAIIEAPRSRVHTIILRQPLLETLFHNHWLRLIVLEPETRTYYRYDGTGGWDAVAQTSAGQLAGAGVGQG